MRTTDFCFPLPEYEHPCLVSYRHLFEAYASPLTKRACTRGQGTGEPGVSRRRIRFGGLPRVGARHFVLPRAPDRAGPLTPLSPSGFSLALSRQVFHPIAKAASFASP